MHLRNASHVLGVSGVVSVKGGLVAGSSGDGIAARSAGSLSLDGVQVGKSGQGNLGHGLLADGASPLLVKIRGSTLASNRKAAVALAGEQTTLDLGNELEPGGNSLQGNVLENQGSLPSNSPLAELLDLRAKAGPPISVRGLDVDGIPFLKAPKLYTGPLAEVPLVYRFGLRITGAGSVQAY